MLSGGHELAEIVSDDAFEDDFDAELVELLGEIERIGVHAVGSEEFGTYRDDFCVHSGKFKSKAWTAEGSWIFRGFDSGNEEVKVPTLSQTTRQRWGTHGFVFDSNLLFGEEALACDVPGEMMDRAGRGEDYGAAGGEG